MPFHGNSHVNILSEDVIKLLKDTGCEYLAMGIESGNEHLRKSVLNRNMSNEQIIEAFSLGRKYGIKFTSYIMVGAPFEKIENTLESVKLTATVMCHKAHVSIFQPYPHTRLYEICRQNGFLGDNANGVSTFFGKSVLKLPTISKEQIQFAYKYFPIFVKLYRMTYYVRVGNLSICIERLLDKLYLIRVHNLYLRIYPVVFAVVFPVVFLKRLSLKIAPELSRKIRKMIFKRRYM